MRLGKFATAAAALSFVGAASAAAWWWTAIKPVSDVQRQVRQVLDDPESARFDDVVFFWETGAGCGVVNAKNKTGAYAGFAIFVALADGTVHFGPSEDLPPEEMSTVANIEKIKVVVGQARKSCPGY